MLQLAKKKQARGAVMMVTLAVLLGVVLACASGDSGTAASPAPAPAVQAEAAPAAAVPAPDQAPSTAAAAQFAVAPEEGMPQYGGVLRLGGFAPKILSVLDNAARETATAVSPVYDRIVRWKFEGGTKQFRTYAPALAKSWDVSADGTVWTFHLEEGVKLHDGSPLTSADVKASLDHYLNPGDAGPPARSYVKPLVASVDAPDPQTVVLHLKGPSGVLLNNLALGWVMVVPKKFLDQGIEWFQTNAVGSGPYRWVPDKWERGVSHFVERNPDYWMEGLPYLDGVQTFAIPDIAARIAAFEAKKIDQLDAASFSQVDGLEKRYGDQVRVIRVPSMSFEQIFVNSEVEPFNDVRVREALYLWLDRPVFLQKRQQGQGFPGDWIEPTTFPGLGTSRDELRANNLAHQEDKTKARARAKEILAQAGYDDLGKYTIRVVPGRPQPVVGYLEGGQVLVSQLREMGFDAQLVTKERLAVVKSYRSGDYDVAYEGGGVGYKSPEAILSRYLGNGGQRLYTRLEDPVLGDLIPQVYTAVDPVRRQDLIRRIDEYLQTGRNGKYLMFYKQRAVVEWEHLRGYRYLTSNQEHVNLRTWLTKSAPGRK